MTAPIPEGAGEPAEVEINFEPDEFGIKISAVLGDSSIVVEHAWDAANEATTLVQALPGIMSAVQTALDQQESS